MAFKSINPHQPSDVVGEFEETGPGGVDAAVARARKTLRGWREEPAASRGKALARIADDLEERSEELARLIVREVGKPVVEARGEVARAVSILRYYAQIVLAPDGETYPATRAAEWLIARRYPVGVCALLTPWNFPVAIPLWKAAPALVYGNAVILKPAAEGTAVAQTVAGVVNSHLPEDVFQVVPGDAETGEPLVDHPGVDAISFTGSTKVGQIVAGRAVGRGAKVQCEMGGQNPSLVLAGADLDRAASTIAHAAMGYAGQKCTATSRVIVEGSVYDELRDRLVAAVEALEVVGPESESCQVGPVIAGEARENALEAMQNGGGRTLTGGKEMDGDGFYLAPSLVELEDFGSPLAREEVFAPVSALLKVGSADEAIRVANDVRYGLAAAVFTNNLDEAMKVADRLEAGLLKINGSTAGVDYHAPFGGIKQSGIGTKEQGLAARDFFTESKTILLSP